MSAETSSATVWPYRRFFLMAFSYSTGLTMPRGISSWHIRTSIGILLLLPIRLFLMFIMTIPCTFIELALGQYSNKSVIRVYDLCPILRGVGICSFISLIVYQAYFNILCASSLIFTVSSLKAPLPWTTCNESWNTIYCYTLGDNITRRHDCMLKYSLKECRETHWESSVSQFYIYRIFRTNRISGKFGIPSVEMLVYTLFSTAIIFFANFSGPQSTDKYLLILAVIPTIQLLVLFIIPLVHETGYISVSYLFNQVNFKHLKRLKTWTKLIEISLRDCGLGFGAFITLGTNCSFRSPLHFKSFAINISIMAFTALYNVTVQNFFTALIIENKMPHKDLAHLEKDLAMPEAVFFLPMASHFWMSMWLSHTYLVGLRSMIAMMCLNAETFYDSIPLARKHHTLCIFLFCTLIYGIGILLTTESGLFIIRILMKTGQEIIPLVLNTFQLAAVSYIYGIYTWHDDIHFMLGISCSRFQRMLHALHPLLFGCILAINIKVYFERKRAQPFRWLEIFQHVVTWFSFAVIFLYALCFTVYCFANRNFKIFKASDNWGPMDPMLKKSREMFTAHNMSKEYVYRQARLSLNEEEQL